MKTLFFGGIATVIVLLFGMAAMPVRQSDSQFRQEFLKRINLVRQKGCNCGGTYMPPTQPLTWNNQLEDAALGHARDMASRNYFSHTSKDGRSMADRINATGYNFKGYKSFTVGENIAAGQLDIQEVVNGWFKSEGHCRNLMNPSFREVGIAEYNHYWVQDFGGREPFSAEEQKLIKSGKYKNDPKRCLDSLSNILSTLLIEPH